MEACINRPGNVSEVLSPIYVVAGAPRARGVGGGVRGGVGGILLLVKGAEVLRVPQALLNQGIAAQCTLMRPKSQNTPSQVVYMVIL